MTELVLDVWSQHERATKRRAREEITEQIPYKAEGEIRYVEKKIYAGEMEQLEIDHVGELLTTPAGLDTLVKKTVLDLEQGREEVQLVYPPLYRRRENRGFTKNVEVGVTSGQARSVFLEHVEGEEVIFGRRVFGAKDTVPIITYTDGFQWTEDLEEYDDTWTAEEANRSIGEAWNALLNHIHLYPIISYAYAAKNKTAGFGGTDPINVRDRQTFKNALEHAAIDKNPDTGRVRNPTVILAASANRFRIQEALQRMQIAGTVLEAIGQQLNTIILYDGYTVTVGAKTYTYAGVPTTKVYLCDPRTYFHELVKHDLLVDAGDGDLSRLILQQIVARGRRGVYASPAYAVEEVTLPV